MRVLPGAEAVGTSAAGGIRSRRWPFAFVACAGLMGAAGVGIGAAAAHRGGGDLARTASEFLLVHAAAVAGAGALGVASRHSSGVLAAALTLLVLGPVLFGGELALAGLFDWRPLPIAAPLGGLCMIAGWLLLTLGAVLLVRRP